MKTLSVVLSCIGLVCAALPAMAEVHVPAGDLNDGVESLAKQVGVNVIYPGTLLDGHTTAGVDGALVPREAFDKLLEGTSLGLSEERGALRIVKAAPAEPVANPGASSPALLQMPPGPATVAASECHRVVQSSKTQRYCGSADQWKDLQARVGFRCRNAGKRSELCASAAEWKRVDLAAVSRTSRENLYRRDEATDASMQSHPVNTGFSGPTMSAPVTPPAPAPTPAK